MMFSIFTLLLLWASLRHANADRVYMFDASCNTVPGMLDFVRSTFTNAQAMAQAAYVATSQNPMDPRVQTVLNSLVNPTPSIDSTPANLAAEIFGSDEGVTRFTRGEVTSNDLLGPNDVKICCDQSRIQQREDGRWVDTDTMDEEPDNDRAKCRAFRANFDGTFALMYAVHADGYPSSSGTVNSFWQIQICPFFLDWALPIETKALLSTVATGTTYRRIWRDVTIRLALKLGAKWKYTPIDAVSLFDKVLLHELTHATEGRRVTKDVIIGSEPAYGWKLCTALSTSNSINDGSQNNADTWALFGSIAWQLQQGLITAVNADGSFVAA